MKRDLQAMHSHYYHDYFLPFAKKHLSDKLYADLWQAGNGFHHPLNCAILRIAEMEKAMEASNKKDAELEECRREIRSLRSKLAAALRKQKPPTNPEPDRELAAFVSESIDTYLL